MDKEQREMIENANEVRNERNNARVAMLDKISDSNPEKDGDEPEEQVEFKDEAAEAEARAAAEDTEARRLQEEGVTVDDVVTETIPPESDEKVINGVTHYLQVVNGAERWLTLKQIRESAAKVDSADEYLRQASENVRNAARVALSPQRDVPTRLTKDQLADLYRRQAVGDEEAIEKLASYQSSLSESDAEILNKIDQRLSLRTELAELQTEYKDILGDEYLGDLFRARLNKIKAEAPTTLISEAYHKVGKELRTRFGTNLKPNTVQQKLERKRTLPQVPTAAARQVVETEAEGDEESGYKDIIAEMAKARQPRPNPYARRRQ